MADFKLRIPVYEIVDETGALKFLFFYETNFVPKHGEKLITLVEIDDKTNKIFYYRITDIMKCTIMVDDVVLDCEKEPIIVYVKKITEEEKKL